jgi:prevent-host-death family protein
MGPVSLKEARKRLGVLVRAAARGESVVITVHGTEAAQIGPIQRKRLRRFPDLTEFRKSIKLQGKPMSETVIEMRREAPY